MEGYIVSSTTKDEKWQQPRHLKKQLAYRFFGVKVLLLSLYCRLFNESGVDNRVTIIHCDSQSAIHLTEDHIHHKSTKYADVKHHEMTKYANVRYHFI